ncbi:MAG: hypothetical protein ACFUZC_10205 [Chthoniobacteraceae bacterium]
MQSPHVHAITILARWRFIGGTTATTLAVIVMAAVVAVLAGAAAL